jgi:hypothetical protein
MFENEFQMLFYKSILSYSKGLFQNPNSILHYASKMLLLKFIKFYLKILFDFENLFILFYKCCVNF